MPDQRPLAERTDFEIGAIAAIRGIDVAQVVGWYEEVPEGVREELILLIEQHDSIEVLDHEGSPQGGQP